MNNVVFVGMGLASTLALPMVVKAQGIDARYVCTILPNEEASQFRLVRDVEIALNIKIEDIGLGKTPLQLFREQKFIANSLHDSCSRVLKRERALQFMKTEYPAGANIYIGIGAHETDRQLSIVKNWSASGYTVKMPLIDMKWINTPMLMSLCEKMFGYIPELYKHGFPHGNCHGACVKAGIKQWIRLYEIYPDVYREWEETEEYVREHTGKDVSMLREMVKGVRKPLTLKRLREERMGEEYPEDKNTGCRHCEAI